MQQLKSAIDHSVNFVFDNGQEARFVKRNDDYFIVYLSSHNGCNQACRFCHLTQSGQTSMVPTTIDEFVDQARTVIDYWKTTEMRERAIYFNFMARGEPLLNPHVYEWRKLREELYSIVPRGLNVKFKISTIMPRGVENLTQFKYYDTYIYYSLYSFDDDFRRRWLPKSMQPGRAFDLLRNFSDEGAHIVFHWALIDNENDGVIDNVRLQHAITHRFPQSRINIVRYNPYSEKQGIESDQIIEVVGTLRRAEGAVPVKLIPKVGFDVKASCGMFVK